MTRAPAVHALLLMALLLLTQVASAGTIGVSVTVEHEERGPISASMAAANAWHALSAEHGHQPTFIDATVEALADATLTTHLDIRVQTPIIAHSTAGGFRVGHTPIITVVERQLRGGQLRVTRISRVAEPAWFMSPGPGGELIELPERALQRALTRALVTTPAPIWGSLPANTVVVPVVLVGERAFQHRWGDAWREVASKRIARADAMLRTIGIRLEIVGYEPWDAGHAGKDAADALTALAAVIPNAAGEPLRVGLLGAGPRADHEVGRAYQPGAAVVVTEPDALSGVDGDWAHVQAGIVLAHEVLHALGAPHIGFEHHLPGQSSADQRNTLMAATHHGSVHQIDGNTGHIARAAALARWSDSRPDTALAQLSNAAELGIDDTDLRVRFVLGNLALGPGIPSLTEAGPDALTPTASLALRAYWQSEPASSSTTPIATDAPHPWGPLTR